MRLRRAAGGLVAAALLSLAAPGVPAASADGLGFDFESGTQGFYAPTWLGSNAGDAFQDSTYASQGTYSLAVPVSFNNGGFEQAGADGALPGAPVDLSTYRAVSFDVYAPVAGLQADLVFNNPWHPPTSLHPLSQGWNTITEDISPSSPDFPGGIATGMEIVLRVVAQGVTYHGDVWFDNVRFIQTTNPVVHLLAPVTDDTLSVAQGSAYQLSATVTPSGSRTITAVIWTATSQAGALKGSGAMSFDAGSGQWTAPWDVWAGGDGVRTVAITASDDQGGSTTVSATVLVQDSQLRVSVLTPVFDETLRATVSVVGRVTPDPRFPLQSVRLVSDGLDVPMKLGPAGGGGARTAHVRLDTRRLSNGVHTLKVVAADEAFTVLGAVDVQVQNHLTRSGFVGTDGTVFTANGQPFRYVGWNEYELFTRQDTTTQHVQEDGQGNVIPKGTTFTWQHQIDREMLEAERHHLTVLRTWGFDENPDTYAFWSGPGEFNEAEFQRFDYIMDSARRHHIRVIVTLANYWGDYGGIGKYAQWLGLANKLQFFTDPAARALYQQYVEHFVNRINTVNGIAYRNDPTIFSWELMNEPRMDCNDDPTPDHEYCDPSGAALRAWTQAEASFIKQLDHHHMVSQGAEAHGLVQTSAGPFQWGGTEEGNGNDPYGAQNVPAIDFLTFHPYPNASWAQFTLAQTRRLVAGLTTMGVAHEKPVVMEEFGVDRTLPVTTAAGEYVPATDPRYPALRTKWYAAMLSQAYRHGAAGTNIWMIADWSDANLNVNLYLPAPDVARDAPIVALLDGWAARLGPTP